MWLRLRQICLVTEKLAPVQEALDDVLRVKVAYRDPGIDIVATDKTAILASAKARGAVSGASQISLCAMRINLL